MKVVRAAIKFKQLNCQNTEYKIRYGWRHGTIFQEMFADGIQYDKSDYQTGFLVDDRPLHFVTREEAAKIAYESGQVKELKDTIYSEDLWTAEGHLI